MSKTLIVPGLDGSAAPHWQDWWARTDPDAVMLDMGNHTHPVREVWEAALAVQILKNPGCVLVGHSLGAVTIANLLTRWSGLNVHAALLVAPADPSRSERTRRFGPLPRGRFGVPSLVVASRNDPWLDFEQAQHLAQGWDAELIDLGHAGHINCASGFGPWPQGKLLRDGLVAQTAQPSLLRRMFGAALRPSTQHLPA